MKIFFLLFSFVLANPSDFDTLGVQHYTTQQVTRSEWVRVPKYCSKGQICGYSLQLRKWVETVQVPVAAETITSDAVVFSDAVGYVTPQAAVLRTLAYLQPKPNEVFLDVGSGDGRVVITAAKVYGCRAIGIEQDPARIAEARATAARAGVSGLVTFIEGDYKTMAWPAADVGYIYQFPEDLAPVRNKLLALDRFASYAHQIPQLPMYEINGGETYVWLHSRPFMYWGGRPKYGRDCNQPGCTMCATIMSSINEQRSYRGH